MKNNLGQLGGPPPYPAASGPANPDPPREIVMQLQELQRIAEVFANAILEL